MESKSKILEKRHRMASFIAAKRESLNMTQQALADASGCSRHTIMRIEAEIFSPNADQLYAILEALGVKIKVGNIVF